jgi:Ca2+/Na+ antiporter
MPANSKYLTASRAQRFAKISAGILGGYFVSMSIFLALAAWFNHVNIIISGAFAGFILWVTFMLLAFLSKNGWLAWLLYLLITVVFVAVAYLGKTYNPHFLGHE